jgi:hypothetical protein
MEDFHAHHDDINRRSDFMRARSASTPPARAAAVLSAAPAISIEAAVAAHNEYV